MAEHPWVVVAMAQAQRNLVPAERRLADLEAIQTDLLQVVGLQKDRLDDCLARCDALQRRCEALDERQHRLASLIRSVEAGR